MNILSRTSHMGLEGRPLRLISTLIAVTGFSLFGYDQGLMAGIITAPQFNDDFPATLSHGKDDTHATVIQGAVTSCYEIGCFMGAIFVLLYGDKFGRKPMVVFGSLIIVVGTILCIVAFREHWGLGQFVIGRVVTGVGNGLMTATIPVWQSEMVRAENRGRMVNLEGSVVAIGTFLAYWIDFGLSYASGSVSWRLPISLQIVFAVFVFFGMIQMPESPKWLLAHDRKEEALYVMSKLKGTEPTDDEIVAEVTMMEDGLNVLRNIKTGYSDLFTNGKGQHFQRMLVGASTQFFQQFTGCNAAIYYSTVLFEETIQLDRRMALILGGVFATVYALATIPSFFLIETLGRRNLFLIGATGQAISFTITFACLIDSTKQNAKGAAVGLFLFIVFFAFTILPLPWIYPPEINPLRTRTTATAVSTCSNWVSNFAVVMFTPIFIGKSGWGCYLFFALMNYLWIPIIFFFYPETAGRSLEEIDIIYAKSHLDGRQAWRVAATMPKLNYSEIVDMSNELGLFEGDAEKAQLEVAEAKTLQLGPDEILDFNADSSSAEYKSNDRV